MSFYSDASLVMIPSGYKTSKVYCAKPTDGSGDLVFSRSNDTATRVGSDGLIEKVRTNIALYSEDQTNWTSQNETSVTANAAANPLNGAVTADKVIPSAVTDDHYRGLSMGSMVGEISSSIYVKADGYSIIDYGVYNSTAANYPVRAVFDLSTETITFIDGSIASITSVGSGWYRISVTGLVASTSTIGIFHRVRPSGTGGTYAGNGTSGMLLWGCQLESGVTTPYIGPTTSAAVSVGPVANVPRLDYLGSSCPRLLLEPQRTNLALQSESVTTSTTNVGYTATSNATTSPDGYASADQILEDTSTLHLVQKEFTVGSTTDTYAASFFVKANGRTSGKILYGLGDVPYSSVEATFNLTAGTITAALGANGATAGTSKIENYGNGWYRVSVTGVIGTAGPHYVRLQDNNGGVAGDPTKGFFVWGFQAELGSYSTSMVPTLGASVTRGADAAYKTGISSLIGQTEGTLFAEFKADGTNPSARIISVSDGSTANRIVLLQDGASIRVYVASAGVGQVDISFGTWLGSHKIAVAYANNDLVVYLDGVSVATDTSISVPACSAAQVGTFEENTNATPLGGGVKQALLFKTRLSNSELASLTA